ncbi:hypothetical protein PS664_03884 [Pseudomonas fluorescens]|nr:hypothetical protein PS664_03884 [Pseudomonas fluorescens]
MNTYKYSSYYKCGLIFEELSKEEQERNIGLFYTDVVNLFEDGDEIISMDDNGIVSIQTTLDENECDDMVAKVAIGLYLLPMKQ